MWNPTIQTFTLNSDLTLAIGDTLTIESGVTLTISSGVTIDNSGTIINSGAIDNHGAINNHNSGTINNNHNSGTINNYYGGFILNFGTIYNVYLDGYINNWGTINNGTIINHDYIDNWCCFNNYGGGTIFPNSVNNAPVADANGPYTTGTAGVPLTLDGSGSSDPDVDDAISSWEWDFGDSTPTGTGVSPTHTYAVGTYTVTLTVTDNCGATDTATTTVTVSQNPVNNAPVADANGPYKGTVGGTINFDGSGSYDLDGSATIVSWKWKFGDSTKGTGVSPTHAYTAAGIYTVTLTVTDNCDATDTATTKVTVYLVNNAPVADANGPYKGTVGVPLPLDGSGSSDPDVGDAIVSWKWDFGDSTPTGIGVSPTHTYTAEGTYEVTLTVTDNRDATGKDKTEVTVYSEAIPEFSTIALPVASILGLLFLFNNHRKRRKED